MVILKEMLQLLVWIQLLSVNYQTLALVSSDVKCTTTMTAGSSNPAGSTAGGVDNNREVTYMAETPGYSFDCCGVITQWEVVAGNPGTIQFQVWRRKSTNVYELIGENQCAVTAAEVSTLKTCTVIAESRIVVRKGDFMGWHTEGLAMVQFRENYFTDSTLDNMFRRAFFGDTLPGDTYDWSTVEAYNDRDFSIRVTYIASSTPAISPATETVQVPDYVPSGYPITSFTYSDADVLENSTLTLYQSQGSAYFSVNTATGSVIIAAPYRPRTDTLKHVVFDQCYNTHEATVTLNVNPTVLVVDNLDADITVNEAITSQTLLHTLTATEYSDEWYCYSNWATNLPFMLKALSNITYGLYLVEHPGLIYINTNTYTLSTQCLENRVTDTNTITRQYNIYLTKNVAPRIDNLDASVSVDAELAYKGDTVFSVNATDAGDIVTFALTSCTGVQNAGATCPFVMTKNGDLQVNTNLLLDTNTQYDIVVTATDSFTHTDSGNLLVNLAKLKHISTTTLLGLDCLPGKISQENQALEINDTDDTIKFTNFPPALQIRENQPLGTSIYNFEFEDTDNDTKTWIVSYSDTRFTRHLTLDPSSGLLSTAYSIIDYEELGSTVYTATVMMTDIQSSSTKTLDITILNENEAPYFTEENFHIEAAENADGTQITDGSLFSNVMIPVDAGDSHEYYLDCGNASNTHRFYMTEATGAIVYRGEMDVDNSSTPTDYECTVTVVDALGLNGSATLYIHILNQNEFAPQFTQATYTLYLPVTILVGTFVQTLSAIDYDSSEDFHNEITYTLESTETMFAINHLGMIYTAADVSGYTGSFKALASNYGQGQTGTTTVTVSIITTTTPAPTTTTDRNKGFYEDRWTYTWMLLTIGGVICMIIGVALVFFRICRLSRIYPWCYNCCRRGPCCRPKPQRPKGFGDKGYEKVTFGHRHVYADEDDEIDGWLKNTQRRERDYKKEKITSGGPVPVIVDADGRVSSTAGLYEDEHQRPLHELRRLQTPSGSIPKRASYNNPHPNQVLKSKWKGTHRNRGSILKKTPSSWNM